MLNKKKISTYALNASRNKTLVGSVETETLNCSRGGTLTVSASIARPDGEPTAGDSFTITANNCVESDGTITGILRLSINTLSGIFYSDNYSGSVTFTFDSLSVSDSQFSARVNGLLTLATTATGINRFTDSYSTPSLAVTASYAGETRSRTLSGFSAIQTRTPVGSSFSTSYDIRGTVTSSALESKSVSFATTTLLVESASDFYPSSGVVTISGAANSKIKLNALPGSLVLQELDANGDGIFESSSTISWSSLL